MAAETIALNVNVNTGEAVSSLGQLEKATKKVGQTTKEVAKDTQTLDQQFDALNKEIKESPVNIRAMNKQIQKYQAIALEAGRTSPLGKQAIQKAAALKDRYIDIQNEVNRLANDGVKLKAVLDIGSTMVAGFAGFQGVMALAGGESEELRETMVKLQGAMSLLMAVETLRKNLEKESTIVLVAKNTAEKASVMWTNAMTAAQTAYNFVVGVGSKAMKVFKIALAATGIGAIVVGIGLLITNFDKVTAAVKWFADIVYKFFKPQIDLVIDALQWLGIVASDEAQAQDAAAQKLIKASEDRRKEIDKLQKKNEELNESVNNGLEFEIKMRKANGKDTTELERKLLKQRIEQAKIDQKLQLEKTQRLIKEFALKVQMGDFDNEQVAAFKENAEAQLQTIRDNTISIRDLKQGLALWEVETENKKNDEIIKSKEKNAKKSKKIDKKATTEKVVDKEKLLADEIKREDEQFALLQELRNSEQENEINQLVLQYEKKFELANGNAELEKALAEQQAIDIEAINKTYDDKEKEVAKEKAALEKEAADKIKEDKEAERQQDLDDMNMRLDNASGFLDSLQTLNNVASGKSEAQQKKAFERNKKIESAQAMISAAKGVVNILGGTSIIPEPFASVQKGVNIAILAATLAAQLKKINSAKFGGGGGGSIQTPSLSGGGGGSVPTLNPVSNTNTVLGQDNKVYVTETDISNTQNKVKVIEERATF